MYDIDLHIIITEGWSGYKQEWFKECIRSLDKEPVNIHLVKGVIGDISKGRIEGFNRGDAKYITYVDPDDYLEPGIINKVLEHFHNNPDIDVIGSNERVIDGDGKELRIQGHNVYQTELNHSSLDHIHPLLVAKRSSVLPIINSISTIPVRIEKLIWMEVWKANKKFKFIDDVGYNWRLHAHNAHSVFKLSKDNEKILDRVYMSIRGDG